MTTSTGPERELLAGSMAFDELFRVHRDRLWSVAVRTLGDVTDAEDVVQETFVAALGAGRAAGRGPRRGSGRRTDGFRGEADVGTWLYRILVNKCIDRLRRPRTVPERRPVTAHDPSGGVTTRLVVDEALRMLPAEQRLAVVLVDVDGWSVAEAARILDVREGTVKSRCARGRLRLAALLGHLREDG